jgi:hypothetical protein
MNRISPPDPPRRLGGLDTAVSFAVVGIVAVASIVLISCATGALPGLTTVIPQAFGATIGNQGGGNYFSGPGRSPSYGAAAIANGFGPGANNKSSQQASGSGGQTCGCGQTNGDNPGHH